MTVVLSYFSSNNLGLLHLSPRVERTLSPPRVFGLISSSSLLPFEILYVTDYTLPPIDCAPTNSYKFHLPSIKISLSLSSARSITNIQPAPPTTNHQTTATMWHLGNQEIGEVDAPFVFFALLFTILSFLAVAGRVYTRLRISREIGVDDYFIVGAEVCPLMLMNLNLPHSIQS